MRKRASECLALFFCCQNFSQYITMTEKIFREEKNEIVPMLKDKVVLSSLAQFIGCSQDALTAAVKLRMQASTQEQVRLWTVTEDKAVNNGYHTFAVPKNSSPGEYRTISAPAEPLKLIQKSLVSSLRQIPISWAAQWGEPWTSPVINAKHHLRWSYLYTTDIKSAYPSVDPHRMFKNLEGGLDKHLQFTYPHLSHEQRTNFLHLLVTLISYHDSLPQWAPTSSRMLNIAMAKTDSDLFRYFKWPDAEVQGAMYTRYVDDIAISFKQFNDVATYISGLEKILKESQKLKWSLENTDKTKQYINQQLWRINKQIEKPVEVPNEPTRKKLRQVFIATNELLSDAKNHPYAQGNDEYKERLHTMIHELHLRMKSLDQQDTSAQEHQFRNKIQKIVNANGRTLKLSKDRYRGPDSSTAKEITGVMIWPDGRLGISKQKMQRYVNLARTAFQFPFKLDKKYLNEDWSINAIQLSYALNGVRNFIIEVKWRSPDYFEKRYLWCKKKYFSQLSSNHKHYAFAGGSNGGV